MMHIAKSNTIHRDDAVGLDMTPLLDVVFIMLIFFIVTASFIKDKAIDVSQEESTDQVEVDPNLRPITIRLEESGVVWVNETATDIDGMAAHVKQLHSINPAAKIYIRALPRSKTDLMIRALDKTNAIGVKASLLKVVK